MALVYGINVINLEALKSAFVAFSLNQTPPGTVTAAVNKKEDKTDFLLLHGMGELRMTISLRVENKDQQTVIDWLNEMKIKHFEADDVVISDGSDIVHLL